MYPFILVKQHLILELNKSLNATHLKKIAFTQISTELKIEAHPSHEPSGLCILLQ